MSSIRNCCAALTIVLVGYLTVIADDVFEKPVRLRADEEIIDTGPQWGHSSPCIEDVDGDGLRDLLLGDFSGKFRVYKNSGSNEQPKYTDAGNLRAGDADATVRIYCCVGGQPRFVDLDGDGIRDFISSSYDPGSCYFFRGLPEHKFAASSEVLDKSGVPVRTSPVQKQTYQSFGSFYAPVDWDADGDVDLLIGCFNGELKLRVNEGNAQHASFAVDNQTIYAGSEPLKVNHHCCPLVVDWDGDGLWDVLAGCDDGSVTWFRNQGSKETPQLAAGVVLVSKFAGNGYNLLRFTEEEIVPGIRSQIEVADLNGDGKLDLLLGDFCTAYEPRANLSADETQQLKQLVADEESRSNPFVAKMEALRKDFATRYPGDAIYSEEADAAWQKEYKELRESPEAKAMEGQEAAFARAMRPLLGSTRGRGDRSFDLAKSHGYVWLFTRK
ncbi:MAG TPA: VCBS repeat-containing protein [Pirellulales bacterium]|nr:VCBS repeat-containing protein [Pirellulales bacterium]